jgi:hypothetical protein
MTTMDLTMTNLMTSDRWCRPCARCQSRVPVRAVPGPLGRPEEAHCPCPCRLQGVGGMWGWGWPRARSPVAIAHLADHVPCRQPPMSGKEQWSSQGGRRYQRMVLHWANWGTERAFYRPRSAPLPTPGGRRAVDPDPGRGRRRRGAQSVNGKFGICT